MDADSNLDETRAILSEAGALETDVRCLGEGNWVVGAAFPFDDGAGGYPQGKPYWGNTARLQSDGTPHWETPQHMARHFVEQYEADKARVAPPPVAEPPADEPIPANDAVTAAEGADMAQPISIIVSPVFNVTGGHATSDAANDAEAANEAHGEADGASSGQPVAPSASGENSSVSTGGDADTGHDSVIEDGHSDKVPAVQLEDLDGPSRSDMADEPAAALETVDETPIPESEAAEPTEALADIVDSGTDDPQDDAAEDMGGADGGSAGGGLQVLHGDGQDGPGDSDLPYALDADFEEIGDDREELAALEFGAEVEDDFLPPPKSEEAPPPPQDRFIGLDDLDRRRSLRIGDVIRYALEHTPRMSGEQIDRLRNLRSYVAGVAEQTVTRSSDDSAMRAELNELEALLGIEHAWDAARDQKVTFLNAAERADVEAFDPERDWPA